MTLVQTQRLEQQATWIEINREALKHNLAQVRCLALPSAQILSVVKANGYGHGLLEVAQCLKDDIAYFGVSTIPEALTLRAAHIETPILLFGIPLRDAIESAVQSDIALAVSSAAQAREMSEVAQKLRKAAVIHVKIDTGMGRLGLPWQQAEHDIELIKSLPALQLEGVFTHFPQGEVEKDPFTQDQIRKFYKILDSLSKKGVHFAYRHAANSVGIWNYREAHFNLIRPGLILYGLRPDKQITKKVNLKPVLSWRARIALLKSLKSGESTGYGREFIAQEPVTIAILPIGYSHGYPFALSNKGVVLFRGKRYPVVGRVSMDYVAVNLGPEASSASVGDYVTLLGEDRGGTLSGEDFAERAGTIPYEILTQLGPAIPRIVT